LCNGLIILGKCVYLLDKLSVVETTFCTLFLERLIRNTSADKLSLFLSLKLRLFYLLLIGITYSSFF
ncbi:MAG TPA: hypothetical protein PLA68_15130, partial [Panacibacter sp.]|nr:hypothetical protein [Panacibacter sp.]